MPERTRPALVVHQREPLNAETSRAALLETPLTPTDAFYIRNHGPIPELDSARYRLRVDGLVEHELELSLSDLRERFPQREVVATLQCAGNRREGLMAVREIPDEIAWGSGATGTARWRGVALSDVLRAAGLKPEAAHLAFLGADVAADAEPRERFGASIPRVKALAEEVLLAREMNGEDLPATHGAPLRVVVPGYIGARSVKWLERITAQAEMSDNYFQSTAYRLVAPEEEPGKGVGVALGAVAVNCDILEPEDGARLAAGPIAVRGFALAGDDREIVRVDVSTNGGEDWQQATLLDAQGRWAWRRWEARMTLTPGATEIVARAWDSAANTQPSDAAHVWNPKGYVNNSWARIRVVAR